MELAGYIRIFRRWLWLIVSAAIVAGSISFVIARSRPITYQASVTVQVGSSAFQATNINTGQIGVAEQLAQTYLIVVKTHKVLQSTIDKLQLDKLAVPMDTDALDRTFQVRIVPNTSLLTITVVYSDPIFAADIANELAHELIANSPTPLTKDQQQQMVDLQSEITAAQTELQNASDEQKSVEEQLKNASAADKPALETRRSELLTLSNTTRQTLAQLQSTLATLQAQGATNTLNIIEDARVPETPVATPVIPVTILAALLAGAVAAGIAVLFEYLNDTVRSPAEIQTLLGVPSIGSIRPFGKKASYDDKLVAWTQPRSTISEEYRAVRVNLMYKERGAADKKHRTYILTSANPGDGKSVTAANLAVTFAITGMRVLLIDADLRRPVQHRLFNLPNTLGLANFLSSAQINREMGGSKASGESASNRYALRDYLTTTATNAPARSGSLASSLAEAARQVEAGVAVRDDASNGSAPLLHSNRVSLQSIIQKSAVTGLDVIMAGPTPLNPTELLGTVQMQELAEWLATNDQYDVVIFDTPPVLAVSDSSVLANVAGAEVILVVHARKTHRSAAAQAVQHLAGLSIPLAGVVVNRLNPRDTDAGYYGYYYGYYGYGASNAPREAGDNTRLTPSNKAARDDDE